MKLLLIGWQIGFTSETPATVTQPSQAVEHAIHFVAFFAQVRTSAGCSPNQVESAVTRSASSDERLRKPSDRLIAKRHHGIFARRTDA